MVVGKSDARNYAAFRLDEEGEVLWEFNLGRGTAWDEFHEVLVMEDGGYLLGGTTLIRGYHTEYWLVRTAPDSTLLHNGVVCLDPAFPFGFDLVSPYPNPFNATTRLGFAVPRESRVQLRVYDLNGREVATLLDGVRPVGEYRIFWNAENLAAGSYFVRMEAGDFSATRKVLLVK